MIQDPFAQVEKGKELVKTGALATLREVTGISRNHLAGLLGSHGHHVRKWESGDVHWVQYVSAKRIADLWDDYREADEWLVAEGLSWNQLTPLRQAATGLGISAPSLRLRMQDRGFEIIDFGLLGEWTANDEVAQCRR